MENLKEASGPEVGMYWAIARRRRWWLIVPVVLCWVLAIAAAWLMPPKYRSETVILVEQQKVPEQYVMPNVSIDLQRRLQTMSEQILSRTRLQRIIDMYGLYHGERSHQSQDAIIERMRKDIKIDLVKDPSKSDSLTGFKISYTASNANMAQRVTGELASLFIEENLKNRAQLSEDTTAFLQNQLDDASKDLDEQEKRMREFKSKYLGQLPEQLQSNLTILAGLQARLQSATDGLNQAEQQKLYLDSLLSQFKALRNANPDSPAAGLPALDQQLDRLNQELTQLLAKYTPQHPDVLRVKEQIAKTEALKKQLTAEAQSQKKQPPAAGDPLPVSTGQNGSRVPAMLQVESQLKAATLDVSNRKSEIVRLQGQIDSYQSRLNLTPVREQELADVVRNYKKSRENYDSLLQKQQQSELATNLERRQQGETFRVIDPPSLPDKPISPNRFTFSVAGVVLGFGLGFLLTALMEFLNPRVDREDQLGGLLSAPVLATVPGLWTAQEERAMRWTARWQIAALSVLGVVIASVTAAVYYFG